MALGSNIAPAGAVTPSLTRISPNVSDLGQPNDSLIFINDASADQYQIWDSFDTTGANNAFTYFGYHFGGTQRWIGRLIWRTGGDWYGTEGGWFEPIGGGNSYVEYATGWDGTAPTGWTRLTAAQAPVSPAYPANATANGWQVYTFDFLVNCYGIRLSGDPGGTSHFVAAWELEVFPELSPPGGATELTVTAPVGTQSQFPASTLSVHLSNARAQTQSQFPAFALSRDLFNARVQTQSQVPALAISIHLRPPVLTAQVAFPPSSLEGSDTLGPPTLATQSSFFAFSIGIELSNARVQTQSTLNGHQVGNPTDLYPGPVVAQVTFPAHTVSKLAYGPNINATLTPIALKNPGLQAYLNDTFQDSGETRIFESFDIDDQSRTFDWFGFSFGGVQRRIGKLRMVSGADYYGPGSGGWFSSWQIEYATDAGLTTWVPVSVPAVSSPNYPADETVNGWKPYEFTFETPLCYGIRISGDPGGSQNFVAATELEVFELVSLPPDASLTVPLLTLQGTLPAVVLELGLQQSAAVQQRANLPASVISVHLSAPALNVRSTLHPLSLTGGALLLPSPIATQSQFLPAVIGSDLYPNRLTLRGDFFDSKLEIGLTATAPIGASVTFPAHQLVFSDGLVGARVQTQSQFLASELEIILDPPPIEENTLRPVVVTLRGLFPEHRMSVHPTATGVLLPTQSQFPALAVAIVLNASPIVAAVSIPTISLSLASRDIFASPLATQSQFLASKLSVHISATPLVTQSTLHTSTLVETGNLAQGQPLRVVAAHPQSSLSVHLVVQGPVSTQSQFLSGALSLHLSANPMQMVTSFPASEIGRGLAVPRLVAPSYFNDSRVSVHLRANPVLAIVTIPPLSFEINQHLYADPIQQRVSVPAIRIELPLYPPPLSTQSTVQAPIVERLGDLYPPSLGTQSQFPPVLLEQVVRLGYAKTVIAVRSVVIFEGSAPSTTPIGTLVPMSATVPMGDDRPRFGVPKFKFGRPLTFAKGQVATLRYSITDSRGVQIDLRPSANYIALIVRKGLHQNPAVRITGTKQPALGKNVSDFTLNSSFWARLSPGMWRYDVWLVRGSDQIQIVPYSYFHVSPGQGPGVSLPEPPPSTGGSSDFDFGET